jgi:D-alanine-D-alanine ligase
VSRKKALRPLRVLALVHPDLVPPAKADPEELPGKPWKTEYDVVRTLEALGHEVQVLGVGDELGGIRSAMLDFKPQIAFNLLEGFDDVVTFDHNVVAYLELLKVPYTGCNSRGLLLSRDKSLAKQLLSYHRVLGPDFAIFPRGRKVRHSKRLPFPLIVKSLTMDASIGISQASVVDDEEHLVERVRFIHESVGTDALVERYIEGRELYVGVIGNQQLATLPIWELLFKNMPEESRKIATERLKWSLTYQKKRGIVSEEASDLPEAEQQRIRDIAKRVYRTLKLSGYARIDLRLSESGRVYVIEANPNPQLSRDEDFAQSARKSGLDYRDLVQRILNLGLRWEPAQI